MRIRLIIIGIILMSVGMVFSQKKPITNDSYKSWQSLVDYNISGDGKYIYYFYGQQGRRDTCVIKSIENDREVRYVGVNGIPDFKIEGKLLLNSSKDAILLNLNDFTETKFTGARWLDLPTSFNSDFGLFQTDEGVFLLNTKTGNKMEFKRARTGYFNPQGTALFLKYDSSFVRVDPSRNNMEQILDGFEIGQNSFDFSRDKMIFFAKKGSNDHVFYYETLPKKKGHILKELTDSFGALKIDANSPPTFSADGTKIYFKLLTNVPPPNPTDSVITNNVDVWHYKDKYLQSQQLLEPVYIHDHGMFAAFSLLSNSIKIVCDGHDFILDGLTRNKYILIRDEPNEQESYWTKYPTFSIVNIETGTKTVIPYQGKCFVQGLSPDEDFVVWYNVDRKAYFSYEISSKIIREISRKVKVCLFNETSNRMKPGDYGFGGWSEDRKHMFVYDKYDIWCLDLSGEENPFSITGDFGRKSKTSFRFIQGQFGSLNIVPSKDTILLAALDQVKKRNGFWKLFPGTNIPAQLIMDSCIYYFPRMVAYNAPKPLIKADKTNVYIFQKRSAAKAPNVVVTKDFKSTKSLSEINPSQKYNWLTTSLHKWKVPGIGEVDGVLFKPENFDPNKKYPVIFYYYEFLSNDLYQYQNPIPSDGTLNIAWYVSNGYLVFTPDVIHRTNRAGEDALNTLVSGAKYLSKFDWVDSKRFGLQGHSYGGFETNYIISHTNIFAAAQESSGMTDMVGFYGSITRDGKSLAFQTEDGQTNFSGTPWNDPKTYHENSPILKVNKITTPLLMMHNKEDGIVNFSQGIALFNALRRLNKKVWMLQYDGEDHTLQDVQSKLDFNIRQQQFFDHYLKGEPAPIWMIEGIPAKDKGRRSGIALDNLNREP